MADERLLDIQGVSKRFGGFHALTEVSVHVNAGERFGLIGPNGSGKTTLINCVSGALPCDGGRVVFGGKDITAAPGYKHVVIHPRPGGGLTHAKASLETMYGTVYRTAASKVSGREPITSKRARTNGGSRSPGSTRRSLLC